MLNLVVFCFKEMLSFIIIFVVSSTYFPLFYFLKEENKIN